MARPNRWRDFVREYARRNNISYACALTTAECKDQYRARYGNPKRLTQKKERELMGAEDRDAEVVYFEEDNYPVPELVPFQNIIDENAKTQRFRESKERFRMGDEDLFSSRLQQAEKLKELQKSRNTNVRQRALEIEARAKQAQKQQQLSASRILGEDYRPSLRVEEIEEEIPFPREARKIVKKKKPKPILEIVEEEEEPQLTKRKRGRPKKYGSKEEAYKAKIDQNKGYKQAQANRIKEIIKKMKEKPVAYEKLEVAFPQAKDVKKPMNIKVKPRQAPLPRARQAPRAREQEEDKEERIRQERLTMERRLFRIQGIADATKNVKKIIEKMKKTATEPVSSSNLEVKWGVETGDYWVIDGRKLQVHLIDPKSWQLQYISGSSEDFNLPVAVAEKLGRPNREVIDPQEVQNIVIRKKWDTSKNFYKKNTGPMPLNIFSYTPRGRFYDELMKR